MDEIRIIDANVHNLKGVSLTLPRRKLVVFTGVSGSGKSSLAFDTLFAEGQRRYVESLSAYARQFIGQFEKPDVASIEGLSPAIAIDQKSTSATPRSTVGTVTEIVDFLRVLYARIGTPHCPHCGREITPQTLQRIVDHVWQAPLGSRLQVLAPVVRGRKGEYSQLFQSLRKEGFVRARVDGELLLLDELPDDYRLSRNKLHNIDVVVDRIVLRHNESNQHRLTQAIQTALKKAEGFVMVQNLGTGRDGDDETNAAFASETFYSLHLACSACNLSFNEMAPRLFSFNSPYGACETCDGLGVQTALSTTLLVPDETKSLAEGAIPPFHKIAGKYYRTFLKQLSATHNLPVEVPFQQLSAAQKNFLLYGTPLDAASPQKKTSKKSKPLSDEDDDWFGVVEDFDGILPILQHRYAHGSLAMRNYIEAFMDETPCPACQGKRLKPISLAVTLGDTTTGLPIDRLCGLSIDAAHRFIRQLPGTLTDPQREIGRQALIEVENRLKFLLDVGLHYLTLDRRASTLSGGEAQRIRLATQVGSGLSGVLYVLDEPSIGLHPHNNRQLIQTLCRLRDQGNSLIVVEHDEATIRTADWVVDIGPGAGAHGGHIIAEGSADTLAQNPDSLTGQYLSGNKKIPVPLTHHPGSGQVLTLKGATRHNLKNLTVQLPLGKLIGVTGVSGSGKSTLVFDLLYNSLRYHFLKHAARPEGLVALEGLEHLDKFIDIDQAPIGRSARSNPATYVGFFDAIRRIFANTEGARIQGYGPGHFSFNINGGRCEACKGEGYQTLEMNFLPDAHIRCDRCDGQRYHADTLAITFQGKTIADVLAMTVEEAMAFFQKHPSLYRPLKVLHEVGLDYIQLGQPAPTLSGGEAQRIKLAAELCKRSTGKTLYLLDEPTIGLHWKDLANLIEILHRLVEQGNTVIVIEHNLDLIKTCDHLIDLGPEAGEAGGYLVTQGTPQTVAQCEGSYTGQFLQQILSS